MGDRLFVNAQFLIQLLNIISAFLDCKTDLQTVFRFANAIKEQKRIRLYRELSREVEEILFLENEIKEGNVSVEDKILINFVLGSTVTIFTSKVTRRD